MSTILVVDDDRTVLHLISRAFADSGVEVITGNSAQVGFDLLSDHKKRLDACLLDVKLPGISGLEAFHKFHELDAKLPVIFITGSTDSETAIEAIKAGAFDYLVKPLDLCQLKELVHKAIEIRENMQFAAGFPLDPESKGADQQFVGKSPQIQEIYKAIGRVAAQDVTVLIQGESGTGKELVARAIYQHSRRKEKPLLTVNCAAIPETLLESELFGHEKGAFTGAVGRRIGKFEQCSGGTMFLDEIGDMPKLLQSKILHLLQSQEFERVGGNETIRTNVRVIAATNRNLEEMVVKGEFREDLYYRLKGFLISLPPLRDRGEDIILLIQHFLSRYNREMEKTVETISPEVMEILCNYDWPGNVRELENVIRQALINSAGSVLISDFLPDFARLIPEQTIRAERGLSVDLAGFIDERLFAGSENVYAKSVEYLEKYLLARVLEETGGNQSHTAKILGITRGSLRNKLRLLGISIEQVVNITEDDRLIAGKIG